MEISLKDVSLTYMKKTPFEKVAIENINISIPSQKIVGIIGHTGSGKSSLIQLIGGLLLPTSGTIRVGSYEWGNKKSKVLTELRKHIGIVFQYPEYQLFEETVEKDIAFGPKNLGIDESKLPRIVKEAMDLVKLPYDIYAKRSPFELSGGQMRRAAIAGVIASNPNILILDEPTAGLDPKGRKEILQMISNLHDARSMTTIIISHSMDEIASMVDHILVLSNGQLLLEGSPDVIFQQMELLKANGLDIPEITKFVHKLNSSLDLNVPLNCYTMESLEEHIFHYLQKGKKQ